jgi:prevent-host-death family protein
VSDVVTSLCYSDYMNVGIRELKARLSEFIERVERGEVLTITNRGRPIALVTPIPGQDRIEIGLHEGWLTRAEDRPPRDVVPHPPRPGIPPSEDLIRLDRDA